MILRLILIFGVIALLGVTPRPHRVERGFELARRALSSSNPLTSANELAALAELLPWRNSLWEMAGNYAFAGGDAAAAIEYFEGADSLSAAGLLTLGDAYAQSDDLVSAIGAWEESNSHYAPTEESLTRLADAYLTQDDYDSSIAALKQLSTFNFQPSTLYQLGTVLAAHKPASAPPYLIQAAELDPAIEIPARALAFTIQRALARGEPAYTLVAAGREFANLNNWELAAHAFQRAAQLRPDYAEAWAYLGEALQHLENSTNDAGLDQLTQAITLNPASLSANIFLGLYWQRQGNHQHARAYLQTAAALDPDNPALLIQLGEIWAQADDLESAVTLLWQAVELAPNDALPYQALAEFCIRHNFELQQTGLPAARQAVLLAPENPAALDVLGQVFFRLSDRLSAERFWLRALAHDETYAPTHLHLGLLYIFEDQAELAKAHLLSAISQASDITTADHARRLLHDYLTR